MSLYNPLESYYGQHSDVAENVVATNEFKLMSGAESLFKVSKPDNEISTTLGIMRVENLRVNNNLDIGGALVSDVKISDNFLTISSTNTADALDSGVMAKYVSGGSSKYAGLFRSHALDEFALVKGLTQAPISEVGAIQDINMASLNLKNLSASKVSVLAGADSASLDIDGVAHTATLLHNGSSAMVVGSSGVISVGSLSCSSSFSGPSGSKIGGLTLWEGGTAGTSHSIRCSASGNIIMNPQVGAGIYFGYDNPAAYVSTQIVGASASDKITALSIIGGTSPSLTSGVHTITPSLLVSGSSSFQALTSTQITNSGVYVHSTPFITLVNYLGSSDAPDGSAKWYVIDVSECACSKFELSLQRNGGNDNHRVIVDCLDLIGNGRENNNAIFTMIPDKSTSATIPRIAAFATIGIPNTYLYEWGTDRKYLALYIFHGSPTDPNTHSSTLRIRKLMGDNATLPTFYGSFLDPLGTTLTYPADDATHIYTPGSAKIKMSENLPIALPYQWNTYKVEFDSDIKTIGLSEAGSLSVAGTSSITGDLTLGSSLKKGAYTYTLPAASGTFALASNIISYGLPIMGLLSSDTKDTIISADTTLHDDLFTNNLTVNAGITLYPNGWGIYVSGIATINGSVKFNGASAISAAGGAKSGDASASLGQNKQGGTGGDNPTAGEASGNTIVDVGFFKGGAGSPGTDETNYSVRAGSVAGALTKSLHTSAVSFRLPKYFSQLLDASGAKYTAGSGGGASNDNWTGLDFRGLGCGGGAGGGNILIACNELKGSGVVESKGGDGHTRIYNEFTLKGGGGGGGLIYLISRLNTSTITTSVVGGTGYENGLSGKVYTITI